ncbi:M48 family metalloprotease [Streptomyces sp. NPDC021356]|uniref:M48 family metalloprotease n=1 Tax=Streptomyces sp. NPDC021356 TaxID=3154900 RepID=UPI0033FECB76
MRIDVYIPPALSVLLSVISPAIGRRVAPAPAARVLTAAAVGSAGATVWSLALLALTLAGDAPAFLARSGGDGRRLPEPVPEVIAILACLALVAVGIRLGRAVRGEFGTRRALRRLCAGHPGDTELIVAASPVPRAFAIPGSPGRILVTAAMLGALRPQERRVLLAHERAHLTHRHARLVTAVTLAVAADPLLGRVRPTVAFLVERWADERAAAAVGDRTATARALARAALTAGRAAGPAGTLPLTDRAVTRRIAALRSAPPPPLWPVAAAVLALGALPVLGAADATGDLLRLLPLGLA